jgi:hypothetical protein
MGVADGHTRHRRRRRRASQLLGRAGRNCSAGAWGLPLDTDHGSDHLCQVRILADRCCMPPRSAVAGSTGAGRRLAPGLSVAMSMIDLASWLGHGCVWGSQSFGIPSWTGNEPISRNPSGVPILNGLATHGAFKAADLARLCNVFAAVINRATLTGSMTGF